MSNAEQMLDKAKTLLVLDQPFFASLILSMPMVLNDQIDTMATDGDSIFFNSKFVEDLTIEELLFVLAHETMHCVFQHMDRLGDKNHNKWNIATDYVINDLLVKERVGTLPKGGLHDPQLVVKGGGSEQGVYDLLPKSDENKKPGSKGGSMDELMEPKGANGQPATAQEKAQKKADWQVKVTQARNAAKMCGKLSGDLDRLVSDLVKSEVDWRTVLRRFLSERCKTDLSYARPKRRFLAEDIYLPSLTGEKLGAVVIAIDCSGSIGDHELKVFGGEVQAVLEDARPSEVKIVYFDSKVSHVDTYGPDDAVSITAHGGGGTAFSPIFERIAQEETQPVACVVLTDLDCDDFGEAPSYPVLWATTKSTEAPFGDIVKVKIGKK